jgi:hypothetical protein
MGRHDDPDPAPFYTSLGSAILRGLLALFLSFGLYAVLASIRDDNAPPEPSTAFAPTGRATEAFELIPVESDPLDAASEEVPTPGAALADAEQFGGAPTPEDTTIQVLDAGAGTQGIETVTDRLEELGYDIVAVNDATRDYDTTTVFFSDGQQDAAMALRARDARFSEIGPNPNLSEEVDLHIIAGRDWR